MAGIGTLNDIAGRVAATPAGIVSVPDRRNIVAGIQPINAPNFLKFISSTPVSGSSRLIVLFDSFVIERVTTQRSEQIAIHYTNGSPLVDVFHTGPEIMTVAATLPDTGPFYVSGNPAGGYLGESLEVFRALYDKYFRVAAAIGSKQDSVRGIVEFWNKNRFVRGHLIRCAFERQDQTSDTAQIVFDIFIQQSLRGQLRPARRETA